MTNTVLIIDDDISIHRLLQEEAKDERCDCKFIYALSGEEGIKKFIKHEPELVLLDYRLPRQTGKEIAQTLLTINPDVKIWIVSGYFSEENLQVDGIEGVIYKVKDYIKILINILK